MTPVAHARDPGRRTAACALVLLVCPLAHAESPGRADVAFQGYYLGGNSQRLSDISGLAVRFQQFLPSFGLLSGSIENYGQQGGFRTGENYLGLRGWSWAGRKWSFVGGDFRVPTALAEFPFYNVYYPELSVRGFRAEASRPDSSYSFFAGTETLLDGPRVPFRIKAPQSVLGTTAWRKFGRFQTGVRFLRLWSDPKAAEEHPSLFPANRQAGIVNNLDAQALYTPVKNLRLFGEVAAASSDTMTTGLSSFAGAAWETMRFTARANYAYEGVNYLPVVGYFVGDRRGPFAEMRVRPVRRLELFASASRYANNLERNPEVPDFRSSGTSMGLTAGLPWKFSLSGQLSTIRFSATSAAEGGRLISSDNRQISATLSRPAGRHNLRLTTREMDLNSRAAPARQRSRELEDIVTWKRLILGAAARLDSYIGDQRKNSVFVRGSAQVRFTHFSAYAHLEAGNDLVNRTVFATNTVRTNLFGISAIIRRGWSLQLEGFRNNLTTELNQENVFLLGSNGTGVSTFLGAMNQWSVFFRLTRQFHWGGSMPASGFERYTDEQIPLIGTVEGLVRERTMEGTRPAPGVPVRLDGTRTAVTDAAGHFIFAEVPEGDHKVALSAHELPAEFDPGSAREVAVRVAVRRYSRVDLEVVRLAEIEGKLHGPEGAPLDGVLIRLLPTDRYTTPDVEGNFSFYNVPEGDYEVALDEGTLPEDCRLVTPVRLAVATRIGAAMTPAHFTFIKLTRTKPVRRVLDVPAVRP